MCNRWCKRGNSKFFKRIANHRFRKFINKYLYEFSSKRNYHKKFHDNWAIQGDEGRRPCFLREYLRWIKGCEIRNNKKYNEDLEINYWKKIYYRK